MQAETLNCPMCGTSAASDATACEHCGARLATVACPSCFGMIFEGAKFCSHCGARVERTDVTAGAPLPCPRCRVNLGAAVVGNTNLLECGKCAGIWMDTTSLQQICADREKQAAVLGMAVPLPADSNAIETVRYVPCPICNDLMNRVNFAHCSHVIVDVCGKHGTWFDKDELRKVIEFIRAGGMEKARDQEMSALQHERSLLKTDRVVGAWDATPATSNCTQYDVCEIAVSVIGAAIRAWIK